MSATSFTWDNQLMWSWLILSLGWNGQTDQIDQVTNSLKLYSLIVIIQIILWNMFDPKMITLSQGFSNFFLSGPFPNIFKISMTLKCYKLQQI